MRYVLLSLFILSLLPLAAPAQTAKSAKKAESIQELEAKLKKDPEQLKVREKLARAYLNENLNEKVISLLNPYTEQISVATKFDLASAYRGKGDSLNEVRVLKGITTTNEEIFEAYYNMALAQIKLKNEADAIESLRKAITINPGFKPAHDTLLSIFIKADNRYEARETLQDMISRFGKRPELMNSLCRLLSIDGFNKQAITDCQNAILASASFPDNYIYLAQSLKDAEQEGESEKTLLHAARKFPKSEFVQWATGQLYLRKQNFAVAQKYFNNAIAADAKSSRALLGAAETSMELAEYQQALDFYERACKNNPNIKDNILTAAAKLRHKKEDSWAKKMTQKSYLCK